jgi:FkbM family methyltransferase
MKLFPIGKFIIEVPQDNPLQEYSKSYFLYDKAFSDIIQEISTDCPNGYIIDIGANVGDTAAVFSNACNNPIICIEGGEHYVHYLRANAQIIGNHITIIDKFVLPSSALEQNVTYKTERGTGWIEQSESDTTNVSKDKYISIKDVYDFATDKQEDIAFFKLDTDGLDAHLLSDILKIDDKICFFECDFRLKYENNYNKSWYDVFDTIENRIYSAIIYDNFGLPMLTMDRFSKQQIIDLQGYIRTQWMVNHTRINFLDIWIFPQSKKHVYDASCARFRRQLLKPFS